MLSCKYTLFRGKKLLTGVVNAGKIVVFSGFKRVRST